ncbi:hypothetical protein Dsin_033200 [Dipteronia sinensis]|uniref:Uncharacterized protein n=1 Tax=Dipteronia sinensis TaxID=43782 RepID=A0AAD9Z7B3_9ROSI|nr:hypothetical protein Dsin_033200 [Dipteronia sinensis]
MSDNCGGKGSWPELLGAQGVVAAATIKRENPLVSVQFVPEGSLVTTDFVCNRVRVWVDTEGIVIEAPRLVRAQPDTNSLMCIKQATSRNDCLESSTEHHSAVMLDQQHLSSGDHNIINQDRWLA